MKFTTDELEFLSAWAREEWEQSTCYELPAHRLQLAHGVSGAHLITFIKAWARTEQKKDKEILDAAANPEPSWPWGTGVEFSARLAEAESKAPVSLMTCRFSFCEIVRVVTQPPRIREMLVGIEGTVVGLSDADAVGCRDYGVHIDTYGETFAIPEAHLESTGQFGTRAGTVSRSRTKGR